MTLPDDDVLSDFLEDHESLATNYAAAIRHMDTLDKEVVKLAARVEAIERERKGKKGVQALAVLREFLDYHERVADGYAAALERVKALEAEIADLRLQVQVRDRDLALKGKSPPLA